MQLFKAIMLCNVNNNVAAVRNLSLRIGLMMIE